MLGVWLWVTRTTINGRMPFFGTYLSADPLEYIQLTGDVLDQRFIAPVPLKVLLFCSL